MQADANILVFGIVSHKNEAALTTPVSQRDQYRVDALKKTFNFVFTMTQDCDDNISDQVHHLQHAMNSKGASALIKHLDRQNLTVKFDFICLEFVRMPSAYYKNFVTGIGKIPGSPLVGFLKCLRDGGKLNFGCKLLVATIGCKKGSYCDRWPTTKHLLEAEFGESREVEANANPYYQACALVACRSEVYNPVEQLKTKNSNEKPFTEFTVLPDNALS